MSFYNLICKVNPLSRWLLATIHLTITDIPRFRDVWCNLALTELTIYTRTGGGNREQFAEHNAALCAHPLYLRDADDEFDNTFASFTFSIPPEQTAAIISDIETTANNDPGIILDLIEILTTTAQAKIEAAMTAMEGGPQAS